MDELVVVNGVNQAMSWGMPAGRLGLKQLITAHRTGLPDPTIPSKWTLFS